MVNFKSDITKEICDILRCPKGYLSTLSQTTTEDAEELVLLCHRDWIQQMKKEKCIPEEFMLYSSLSEKEIEAFVADRLLEAIWRESLWLIKDGICTTKQLDDIVRYGFGLRYAQMGVFQTYRTAAGEGGI